MNFAKFIHSVFGKDIFSLKEKDIIKERIKLEKQVEGISDEIKKMSSRIEKIMLDSKGQPNTLKMLNVQKIKALRLEARTKQIEATHCLEQLQLIFLVEAMKTREKSERESRITDDILNSDVDKLNSVLRDEEVKKALEDGRLDLVKDKLERVFAKEEAFKDEESKDIAKAIEDLEEADEETAMKLAKEKAKELTEEKVEE
jgi:hypothetical protein